MESKEKKALIYGLAGVIYREVLRDLLEGAVEDSDNEVDDVVLAICDVLFGYAR